MKVVDGALVWKLHATYGFPLELSLPILADRGLVPAWDRLLDAAAADGADVARLIRRLDESCGDAYPPDMADFIRAGLQHLLAARP